MFSKITLLRFNLHSPAIYYCNIPSSFPFQTLIFKKYKIKARPLHIKDCYPLCAKDEP